MKATKEKRSRILRHTTLEWLGTGSGLNFRLGNTSFIVSNGGPTKFLVDCGFTVPSKLAEAGHLDTVTDIAITHLHADHIGGLETLAFCRYFSKQFKGRRKIKLHLATDTIAHDLWEQSLRGGLGKIQNSSGGMEATSLDTYFDVEVGLAVDFPDLPSATLFPTAHVAGMENYGLRFSNGVYYSGDTTDLPPEDPQIIFQDCQSCFDLPGDPHASYERLISKLPRSLRRKIYLVHLGKEISSIRPEVDGFAGSVAPGDIFNI